MPTPIAILMDPISLAILAMYALLVAWEAVFPARVLPEISWWKTRALCTFVVYFYPTTYLPLFIDPFLTSLQVLDLSGLGTIGGCNRGDCTVRSRHLFLAPSHASQCNTMACTSSNAS